MKHLGNLCDLCGWTVPPVDILTGGSPCQNLSVAGNRKGLAGNESGLFLEQIRLFKEMRDASAASGSLRRPRFFVWENVKGAFSCNGGEDFRRVLEEVVRIAEPDASVPRPPSGKGWTHSGAILGDGWSVAWRLHDAQFWGVPQRRTRIALVGDFGGHDAPEILFERKVLPGNLDPGGTAGESPSGTAGTGAGQAVGALSFVERIGKPGGSEVSPTLATTHGGEPAVAFADVADALCAADGPKANHSQKLARPETNFVISVHSTQDPIYAVERTPALSAQAQIAVTELTFANEGIGKWRMTEISTSLRAASGDNGSGGSENAVVNSRNQVRRLTPLECTRLQGFPDGWVDIGDWEDTKGRLHKEADAPKYKALGNSIAIPFWEWMARRMVAILKADGVEHPTMCSLFDGIGGFPLSFQRAGCEPVWASEIEEFPIAVTKRHFPESSKPVSRLPSGGRVEEAKTARKAWAKANKVKLKFGRSA